MADKMMRMAGRGADGLAKAIKTDNEGNVSVQKTNISVSAEFSLEPGQPLASTSFITSKIPGSNGSYLNVEGFKYMDLFVLSKKPHNFNIPANSYQRILPDGANADPYNSGDASLGMSQSSYDDITQDRKLASDGGTFVYIKELKLFGNRYRFNLSANATEETQEYLLVINLYNDGGATSISGESSDLSNVALNGTNYPIRWEIDDQGNAVLATAKVDGLAYSKEKDLHQVEVQNNVDVFYGDNTLNAGQMKAFTFQGLDGDTIDLSKYKSMDVMIRGLDPHEFSWSESAGFRTIDIDFGEFSFSGTEFNIKDISDIAYKSSAESKSANHSYLALINCRIVQSRFSFRVINNSAETQNYHAELRLYKG